MAKQKSNAKLSQSKQERARRAALQKLNAYPRAGLVLLALLLVAAFLPWVGIYNTDITGMEITVSGWAGLFCGLTGSYTAPGALFGDMAVFNYHAAAYCKPLAIYAAIALLCAFAALIVEIPMLIKKIHALHFVNAALCAASAVFSVLGFVTGLGVKDSGILVSYCQSNPACSVRSYAVLVSVLAVAALLTHGIAAVQYVKAKKI